MTPERLAKSQERHLTPDNIAGQQCWKVRARLQWNEMGPLIQLMLDC